VPSTSRVARAQSRAVRFSPEVPSCMRARAMR
jgi:hypothetical protein